MNRWQKNLAMWLIVVLAFFSIASALPKVVAQEFNPTYGGSERTDDQLNIKFSEHNNSIVYLADQDWINYSVTPGSLGSNSLILGAFVCSVSYKASWLSKPVTVSDWSYNDPANRKDDDPNATGCFQGTISLNGAPLGNQKVTITALAGCYTTNVKSYFLCTATTSSTLNFSVASEQPKIPSPSFSSDSDIRWRTDISWDLTGTPAESRWHTDILGIGRAWTKPVVVNGVIYAGATSTVRLNKYGIPTIGWVDIYAFDANSGRKIWHHHTAHTSITNLAWAGGKVYFGATTGENGSLNALDARSGTLIWSTPCSSFRATPVAENGRVILNSGYSLLAFDGVNGEIIWNYTTAGIVVASPVVANGILYSASYDNTLYALKTQDGSKIWSYKTENGFSGYSNVGDFVFASSGDGNIYALNAKTGDKIWSHNTTPPEFTWVNGTGHSIPLYCNRAVYFTSSSHQHIHYSQSNGPDVCQMTVINSVWALDARNGSRIWNITATVAGLGTSVAVCNGIIFTQEERSILGLNTQNGALIWNFTNADLSPTSQPTIADGSIYVGYSDGQLYALRAPSLGIDIEDQDMTVVDDGQNISLEEDEDQNIIPLIIIVAVLALTSITLLFKYRLKLPLNKREKILRGRNLEL